PLYEYVETSTEPTSTPPPTLTAQGSSFEQLAFMFSTMLSDDQSNQKAANITEGQERHHHHHHQPTARAS
ncbi:unnamed protein product, partial [Didymodactylos carnosus]